MPLMSKTIEGCAYNPSANSAAFNIRNMPVVIESKKITIYNAESAAEARGIIDWLEGTIRRSL
jgi:hypothetical protein